MACVRFLSSPLFSGAQRDARAPLPGPTASVPRSALWPQLFWALSGFWLSHGIQLPSRHLLSCIFPLAQ